MLKELRKFSNLGTPAYFYELFSILNKSAENKWTSISINQLFFNRIIDNRRVFDGCIVWAIELGMININSRGYISLNKNISGHLSNVSQMSDKFPEIVFVSLKNDDEFLKIFSSGNINYDSTYETIYIKNSAFGFNYSNLKQFLLDFGIIKIHPIIEMNGFLFNPKYKSLFHDLIIIEIKKKKIYKEEFEKSLENKQKHGEEAEKFILEFENCRLKNKKSIEWVAEYIVNEGYDIASFDNIQDNSFNRFIEVKSYVGDKPYFFWSKNELDIAQKKGKSYWIYLVNRSEMGKLNYAPIMIQDPLKNVYKSDEWSKNIELYKVEMK